LAPHQQDFFVERNSVNSAEVVCGAMTVACGK